MQEKVKGGNSNLARCAMDANKTLFAPADRVPSSTHCNSSQEMWFYDYKIELDETTSSAKIRVLSGDTDYGREIAAIAGTEAKKPVAFDDTYKIIARETGQSTQYADPVTNERYNQPRKSKILNFLLMTSSGSVKFLTIPEDSGRAVLIETVVFGSSSWIEARFGSCQLKK